MEETREEAPVDPGSDGPAIVWVLTEGPGSSPLFPMLAERILAHAGLAASFELRPVVDIDRVLEAIGPDFRPRHGLVVQGGVVGAFRKRCREVGHPALRRHGAFSAYGGHARSEYDVAADIPVLESTKPGDLLAFLTAVLWTDDAVDGDEEAALGRRNRAAERGRRDWESSPAGTAVVAAARRKRRRDDADERRNASAAARRVRHVERHHGGGFPFPSIFEITALRERAAARITRTRRDPVRPGESAALVELLHDLDAQPTWVGNGQVPLIADLIRTPPGTVDLPAVAIAWRLTKAGFPATSITGLLDRDSVAEPEGADEPTLVGA